MADDHVAAEGGGREDVTGVEHGSGTAPSVRGDIVHRTLPLNSRRLTAQTLRQLAEGLGVPSGASSGDLLSMIEGKLAEADRDPLRTQVVLRTGERGVHITLQDETGVFKEIEPPAREDPPPSDPPHEGDEEEVEPAIVTELRAEVERLTAELEAQKKRVRELWKLNCDQLAEMDNSLLQKDEEISRLKADAARSRSRATSPSTHSSVSDDPEPVLGVDSGRRTSHLAVRRGKAPPVDPFTGEESETRLDDWLPTLERAANWNDWTPGDLLIQLAGHLKGRALQEWNLLPADERTTYKGAIAALRSRLDPGSKIMAAQDFRHASQEETEKVGDFIRRLERLFKVAYGRDNMSLETRNAFLYGQLQEGLRYHLMEAPAVSGAPDYQSLCLAAKTEEKRLAELKKRRQYSQGVRRSHSAGSNSPPQQANTKRTDGEAKTTQNGGAAGSGGGAGAKRKPMGRCWTCNEPGHKASECPSMKKKPRSGGDKPSRTQQVQSSLQEEKHPGIGTSDDPLQYLLPDSDEEGVVRVTEVRVKDRGSKPQLVRVEVGGVPLDGVVDTGADITIVGAEAFKRIATVAKLRRQDFKQPDKTPRTYDQKIFHLDGRVDLDITFQQNTMKTPVYVKMDAKEQLLLSEGVCRQLGIVSYHRAVSPGQGEAEGVRGDGAGGEVYVPTVRVALVQSVKLKPRECALVDVRVVSDAGGLGVRLGQDGGGGQAVGGLGVRSVLDGVGGRTADQESEGLPPMLLESDGHMQEVTGVKIVSSLVQLTANGSAQVLLTNHLNLTHKLQEGTEIGYATPVEVVKSDSPGAEDRAHVSTVTSGGDKEDQTRQAELISLLNPELEAVPEEERDQLVTLLRRYHNVFSLENGERGETSLTEVHIETGEATPRRQPMRRVPHAARQEVARQLQLMQRDGIIQPSESPWASAIVLVRKKNGKLRICVDYRHLNAVTKLDAYPLPRIDDLLDQLGSARYFTTLDLAAGYWQIRVADDSVEKTAFVTPQGLFEFRVMPFGLTNAPAVFQRLMTRVLDGLNPPEGPDYVAIYIDDVLIFSRTLEDHLQHIALVLDRIHSAGLKLQPVKCHFVCKQVEYLGHLITPQGLQPNPERVRAVTEFPVPGSVTQVRQFIGLTSYYRRFIRKFAKIAAPLHNLTRKEVEFEWTPDCQSAFEELRSKLVQAPVLVFPDFDTDFVLETDASYQGLGAVLSQRQLDQKLHPVAFASRALSPPEKNYSVTELETLAVVWAMKHFHAYLYGHNVQVVTDHSAVKALLGSPSSSGKHARWWLWVFGSGVKKVEILYRPGRENVQADALSRNPVGGGASDVAHSDVQVAAVTSGEESISDLLMAEPSEITPGDFSLQQKRDPELQKLRVCLESGILPPDGLEARTVAALALHCVIVDNVLYFVEDRKGGGSRQRAAVPRHLQQQVMEDAHGGRNAGHFSGPRLYAVLRRKWWWRNMYKHIVEFCRSCGECATVAGVGRQNKPPLHPIPVQRPFQIVGLDIMELPTTEQGNRYVIVFQDFLTKWPLVFPAPDQKAVRLARLIAEEFVPMFGVPDAVLSDRGTNLLAHVMEDVCRLMGITKLNTTSYHPQCDGMVERLNRSLKSMLRKHVAKFGGQWDRFLPGALWAYRNTPHESTKEKPSFLLFGIDLKSPTEAALLPPDTVSPCELGDYREELIMSLSSARQLATSSVQEAQKHYKKQYDKGAKVTCYRVGDWVFVRFPAEETGKNRKMSRPWHGPYRIVERQDPNLTLGNVYFPQEPGFVVHQLRVCPCPDRLPAGFYWYGSKRRSPGRTPAWLKRLLRSSSEGPATEPTRASHDSGKETGDMTTGVQPVPNDQGEPLELLPEVEDAASCELTDDMNESTFEDEQEMHQAGTVQEQAKRSDPAKSTATNRYSLRDRRKHRGPDRLMRVMTETVRDELN